MVGYNEPGSCNARPADGITLCVSGCIRGCSVICYFPPLFSVTRLRCSPDSVNHVTVDHAKGLVKIMDSVAVSRISAEEFFEGLIMMAVASGVRGLRVSQPDFHRAFYRTVKHLTRTGDSSAVDLADFDYDPLYRLSGWLDNTLTSAQRDLLISFSNPSYDEISLRASVRESEEFLAGLGQEEMLKRAFAQFRAELPNGSLVVRAGEPPTTT
jgi:hypothetical protein